MGLLYWVTLISPILEIFSIQRVVDAQIGDGIGAKIKYNRLFRFGIVI